MSRTKFRAILAQFAVLSMLLLLFGSRAMGTSLPINGSVTGTLTGPAITYSVLVPSDGDLTLNLTTSNTLYGHVTFLDSDGTSGLYGVYASPGTTSTVTVPHLSPGATYYVSVSIYTGSGGFTLSDTLAVPAVANDIELNDTPLTALPLTIGTPVAGHLGYSRATYANVDGVDYYKLVVPADGDLTFTNVTNSTLYSHLVFYDSDGTTALYGVYTSPGSSSTLFVPHLAPGATYYAAVSIYTGYGTYQLSTSLATPVVINDVENNDTYKKALKLADKVTAPGHLGYSRTSYSNVDAIDFYKFSAAANGDINFSLTTNATLYAHVIILDSNGTSVIGNFYTSPATTNTLSVPHYGTGATFYVSVSIYTGYGSYQLTRTLTKQIIKNDVENNDTYLKANLFAPNTTKTGNLGYSRNTYYTVDTIDFYKITVTKAGTFNVKVTTTSTLYAHVNILSTDGSTSLGSYYVSPSTSNNQSVTFPAAGTYYVSVGIYTGYGGYTMTNTFL